MKNKSLTYLLLAGVMCIWGIVFYRIYSSVSKEETSTVLFKSTGPAAAVQEAAGEFILNGNYRDPFLGTMQNTALPRPKKKIASAKPKVPEIPIDWSFIGYSGAVYNKIAKRKVTLMTVRGQSFMVNETEKAGDVTLLKNFGDSIKISYQGKVKFIRLP